MKQSQKLPDGVGKRIIEALKQQTEQPIDSAVALQQESISQQPAYQQPAYQQPQPQEQAVNPAFSAYMQQENVIPYQQQEAPNFQPHYVENEPLSVDENDFSLTNNYAAPVQEASAAAVADMQQYEAAHNDNAYQQQPNIPNTVEHEEVINNNYENGNSDSPSYEQINYYQQPQQQVQQPQQVQQLQQQEVQQQCNEQQQKQPYVHSSNIDTLMWLITQLPAGVTKQTGAHIIRQTMEALGMPMNLVLNEAQQIQDTTNHSIRTKINSIEEYRNNIRILENEVQKERKQVEELEDLISLFILSEKT